MKVRMFLSFLIVACALLPKGAQGADNFLITEFGAANSDTLRDEDGDSSDWVEIHNPGTNTASLLGWFLTDDPERLDRWQFPATNMAPGTYLVVFASGKDRRRPGEPLHTDFAINSAGGYLALVRPDRVSIASHFSPSYPPQVSGISYGTPVLSMPTTLVASGATARVLVPSGGALGTSWTLPTFNDAGWLALPTGVGYESSSGVFTPMLLANSVTEFSGTQGQNNWHYGYWNKTTDANATYADSDFTPFAANQWTGSAWDLPGDPPYTQLTAGGARPTAQDGNPGLQEHWVIRRYINEFNGPVTIRATVTHTSDWVLVSQTGLASSSLLYVYLTGAGEGHIDDMKLVAGSVAGAGPNLLANGDFENPTLTSWNVSANLAGSALTTAIKRTGNQSLRLAFTVGGSTQTNSLWQQITPALTVNGTYTLSYWYLPSTNSPPLITRLSGAGAGGINVTPTYCGDGVVARILADGVPVYQQAVQVARRDFEVVVPAQLGSKIDLAIDAGAGNNDFCDPVAFSATIESADPNLAPIADSEADWSLEGEQGVNGWYYGYYNRTTDGDQIYQAANFIPFPRDGGPPSTNNFWDGDEWKWFAGNPPLTRIGNYWMHPNGINNGAEHWPIRRWVSKAAGTITVNWSAHKEAIDQNNNGGNGVTVRVFHNGTQRDSSFVAGADVAGVARSFTVSGVNVGDTIDIAVDPSSSVSARDDTMDRTFVTAVVRGLPSLSGNLQSSLEASMRHVNASAYVRLPFTVSNPSSFNGLTLRLKYDDGFVAYLNGQEIARALAPMTPEWNSSATGTRSDAVASDYEEFNLGASLGLLQAGNNVLAIHGLNLSADDSDFLVLAQLVASAPTIMPGPNRSFTLPTPGTANGAGTATLGPLVASASHTPSIPLDSEGLVVTAWVIPTLHPINSVRLIHRTMYSNEVNLTMFDDGAHGDGGAGDGVWGATIPASAATNGQMIRYYIYTTDSLNNSNRFPAFPDPKNSAQYRGTVVSNPAHTNPLPVVQMFAQNVTLTTNRNGTRCSIFWDGELYDNAEVNAHGQTTWFVFPKRSMNVNLNSDHQFQWSRGEKRVKAFDLLSPYADKAYMRLLLAFESTRDAGVPTHRTRPVRLDMNGAFNSVMQMVEQSNDEFLERNGLDPEGALYKIYFPLTNAYSGARKETRKQEANDDLAALISGINLTGSALRNYVFDNIDVPEVVNFMAAINLVQNEDCCWYKNYFLYRDTRNTGEWQVMPWDMDLTHGRTFTSGVGYFSTIIYATNAFWTQNRATRDFIGTGAPGFGRTVGDALLDQPDVSDMFYRRWTTVHETFIRQTNVHPLTLYYERRADELLAQIEPDSILDLAKWGTWAPSQSMAQAVSILKTQYFAPRRPWLFNTLRFANGGPYVGPQPTNLLLRITDLEVNPLSGNQDQEYVRIFNPNNISLDISGWKIAGGIDFTFRPGTVIASNGSIYLSPNVKAFRSRTTGPRGGQGLFVQGPYKGQLSTRGESLLLTDTTGRSVASTNIPAAPSLAQLYLRVSEIMYHPAATPGLATNADEFEYIEVKNTGPVPLSLSNLRFAGGIEFNFSSGAVTSLPVGGAALVVRNLAAFASRYGALPNVAGQWTGQLDNMGENILLLDASGEKVLDFEYENDWYPITDGFGFSLVIVNETAPWDTWGMKTSWRPSAGHLGSPGAVDPLPSDVAQVLVTEVLSHSTLPAVDAVELFNNSFTLANVGGWFLTDDFNSPFKYRIPDNTMIEPLGFMVLTEADFNITNPPSPTAFSFSSKGDEVYLFSANVQGDLTGWHHGWSFGAAEDGVSFGHHINSAGEDQFVAQFSLSLSNDNTGPRVGPLVISEIMFHPPEYSGGADNADDEYIEIANITGQSVALRHPTVATDTWRISGGAGFNFPTNVSLASGARLLVANFNPSDTARLASFRARFGVPMSVPVYGPFSGKLDNSADRITLSKPDDLNEGVVPHIVVDQIDYRDSAPWPAGADGTGASLQRRFPSLHGNEPANWLAAAPGAGIPTGSGQAPLITSQPTNTSGPVGGDAMFSVTATGDAPFGYQWSFKGGSIPGATNPVLLLTNLQIAQSGVYNVSVYNAAGVTVSSNATLDAIYAAFFIQQPQSQTIAAGATVNLIAQAIGSANIRYQWRHYGTNVPNATNSTYTIVNVQPSQAGPYQVLAIDGVGAVPSAVAMLTVPVRPAFLQFPVGQTVVPGATVVFSASVSNTASLPLGFRWRRNGATVVMYVVNDYTNYFIATNVQSPASFNVIVTNAVTGPSGTSSPNAVLTFLLDSDADGLSDDWELQYFGGITAASPGIDSDGDTMSNMAEYIAGTDPQNNASYLKVDAIASAGIGATLTFGAVSNRTYTIESSPVADGGPWTRLRDLTASATNRIELINDPGASSIRFYRAVTPRQP